MEENTVILPKIVDLSSSNPCNFDPMLRNPGNDKFKTELKSVDRYLFNKKCNTKYHPDLSHNSIGESSSSLKRCFVSTFDNRLNYYQHSGDFSNSKRRNQEPVSYQDNAVSKDSLVELISNGDQSVIDNIVQLSTSNVKKIMDLLNKATSIKNFQMQLQSLILNMCADIYRDKAKNDENMSNLKHRVKSLTDEKMVLSNVIKSQFESIRKLKGHEENLSKSEEEKRVLKAELGRLKHFVNNMIYKDPGPSDNLFCNNINRGPPDVY